MILFFIKNNTIKKDLKFPGTCVYHPLVLLLPCVV